MVEEKKEKRKITIRQDDFSLGELVELEDMTGKTMDQLFKTVFVTDDEGRRVPDPDDPKGRPLTITRVPMKAMAALLLIVDRRDNPALTMEDVLTYKFGDIDLGVEDEEDADPLESDDSSTKDDASD